MGKSQPQEPEQPTGAEKTSDLLWGPMQQAAR